MVLDLEVLSVCRAVSLIAPKAKLAGMRGRSHSFAGENALGGDHASYTKLQNIQAIRQR